MKSIKRYLLLAAISCFAYQAQLMATELNAEDGIFPSHSTEYVRTLNRNASTDADAAFYNPAGLAMMDKTGLYINFSNQTLHKKRTSTMDFYAIDVSYDAGIMGSDELGIQATDNINPDFYTNFSRGGLESNTDYFAEVYGPAMPDLNIIYKAQRWAAYLSLGIMQAAPEFTFGRGLATSDMATMAVAEQLADVNHDLLDIPGLGTARFTRMTYETNMVVRTEYYVGGTIGAAYRIFDMLSASAGFRYIYYMGQQTIDITGVKGDFTTSLGGTMSNTLYDDMYNDWHLDTTYKGQSYGIILGTDFMPFKSLNIGVRYEYYLPAELKKKTNRFEVNPLLEQTGALDIFKDGSANPDFNDGAGYSHGNGTSTLKVTYPQSISMGISYQLFKSLRLEVGGDVYLKDKVDLDGAEKDFNTAYRVGGCVEYSINDSMVASLGYSYNDTGIKPGCRNEVDPLLLNHSIGTGIGIQVNDRLDFNMGLMYIYYVTAKVDATQDANATMTGVPIAGSVDTQSTCYFTKELAETTFMVSFGATYRIGGGDSSFKDDKEDDVKSEKKDKKKKEKKIKKDDKKQG